MDLLPVLFLLVRALLFFALNFVAQQMQYAC